VEKEKELEPDIRPDMHPHDVYALAVPPHVHKHYAELVVKDEK
jgi:hypothetical protein